MNVWLESAKIWRKLLSVAKRTDRTEIIYHLAYAEMMNKNFKQAVATAFLVVPLAEKNKENKWIGGCIDILLQSAKAGNFQDEYNTALVLKDKLKGKNNVL